MNYDSLFALGIVFAAAIYLVFRFRKKNSSCCGCSGCKNELQSKPTCGCSPDGR